MHFKYAKSIVVTMTFLIGVTCTKEASVYAEKKDPAQETALAGMSAMLSDYYEATKEKPETLQTSLFSESISIPKNIAICKCKNSVNIRAKAGTNYSIIGQLPKDAACIVLGQSNGWAHITSGEVDGYVYTEYLYTGKAGYEKAKSLQTLTATVKANIVNVRSTPSTLSDSNIITEVSKTEDLHVLEKDVVEVVTKNDPKAVVWVKVVIDDMEGYVSREYVDISYKWKSASSLGSVATSSLRSKIISEAKKHIGLRYVWGGTSLSSGADCSGFIWGVYKKCGLSISDIGLPRTSNDMSKSGKRVTKSNIQPGDLVFYGSKSGNVSHVAMYIGNGKVIHESGKNDGCKISNMNYRTILGMRSYLD